MRCQRLEITVLLEELLAFTEAIDRAGEPQRLRSSWINGLKHLPVTVTAGRALMNCDPTPSKRSWFTLARFSRLIVQPTH